MKILTGFVVIFILVLCSSQLFAIENEWHGKANGRWFIITYKQDEKIINISIDNKLSKIPLSGYTIKEMYIKDINSDGNDEVFFLDLAGESAGGELRLFFWNNGRVTEIAEEYSANKITLKQLNRETYILLWQHDIEDLFFCNEVLLFRDGKLLEATSQKVWDEIIVDYTNTAILEKNKWRKSRYYSYLAMAYQKIGNKNEAKQYFNKAKTIDPQNPFAE